MRTNLLNCVRTANATYMLTIDDQGRRRAYKVAAHLAEQAYIQLHVPSPKGTRPIDIELGHQNRIVGWEMVIPSQGLTPSQYLELHGEPYVSDDPTIDV